MSLSIDPLQLLASVASDFEATLAIHEAQARAQVTVTLPSGQQHVFPLEVTQDGGRVTVREASVGHLLPGFCPDRHINSDGSFCLGWGADDPSVVHTTDDARTWWGKVVRYLLHQLSATKRGVWPGREFGRAHGDAAKHQAVAERLAEQFGSEFVSDLRAGALTVRSDGRHRNPRLELYRHGRRVARVFRQSGGLVSDHMRCPCAVPAAPAIAACSDHASVLACFIFALYLWRYEEHLYLRDLVRAGKVCCATLRECGLRATMQNGATQKSRTRSNT